MESKHIQNDRSCIVHRHAWPLRSIDPKTVRIARIVVTSGTRIRRYKPASRGRALPYEKISSNIFVEVAGEEKVKKATSSDKKAANKSADKGSDKKEVKAKKENK